MLFHLFRAGRTITRCEQSFMIWITGRQDKGTAYRWMRSWGAFYSPLIRHNQTQRGKLPPFICTDSVKSGFFHPRFFPPFSNLINFLLSLYLVEEWKRKPTKRSIGIQRNILLWVNQIRMCEPMTVQCLGKDVSNIILKLTTRFDKFPLLQHFLLQNSIPINSLGSPTRRRYLLYFNNFSTYLFQWNIYDFSTQKRSRSK